MGLARIISKFRSNPPALALHELQVSRCAIVEQMERENGMIILSCPIAVQNGAFGKLARKMGREDRKEYELEPIGAFVWNRILGKVSAMALVSALQREFKLSRIEAEASLASFLQLLASRGLINLEARRK
jgi:hypothetical protein